MSFMTKQGQSLSCLIARELFEIMSKIFGQILRKEGNWNGWKGNLREAK